MDHRLDRLPVMLGVGMLCCIVAGCSQDAAPGGGAGTVAGGGSSLVGGRSAAGGTSGDSNSGGGHSGAASAGTPAGGSGTGTAGSSAAGSTQTGSGGIGGSAGRSRTGGSAVGGGTGGTSGASTQPGVRDGGVDARGSGATATGGAGRVDAGGGAGGASSVGGAGGTGGASGGDGCDVGIHDPASPPKVLNLSGNLGVHDPVVIQAGGTYYMFATGLAAKTSSNLTKWDAAGRPFAAPSWMTSAVPGVTDLWAPDISFFGGKYHLYYSGSTFGSNKSCIGHATRDSLSAGSWTDQGSATICSNVGTSDNWNAIDPNVVVDSDGTPWLSFGSFWGGLKIVQLDSAGKRVDKTVTAIAARPDAEGALEAPFIVRRCGFYYLFMAWDSCCKGANSTYNIRVARAAKVTGPYTDKAGTAAMQGGGTLLSKGNSTWAGPGHQAVLFVGQDAYLVYHAYAKSDGAPTLRIANLVWDADGWPVPVGP